MEPVLIIYRSSQKEELVLTKPEYTVGRDSSCEICLADTEVSRRHARFTVTYSSTGHIPMVTLEDLGSLNGTYVNGYSVRKYQLQISDWVQLGGTRIELSTNEHSTPGPVPSAPDQEASDREAPVREAPDREAPVLGTSSSLDVTAPIDSGKDMDFSSESLQPDEGVDVTSGTAADSAQILRTISHKEGEKFLAQNSEIKPLSDETPWTRRAHGYLQLLYDMTLSISHCMDIDRLSKELLELIFRWIDADRGCILIFDSVTNRLVPKAKKIREEFSDQKLIISKTILDYVLEHHEGVLTSDATQDDRWNDAASVLSVGIHEAICVPLQGRYGIVGAIYLDTFSRPNMIDKSQTHRFGDDHLKLMITIAHHTAIAVEDTRYYRGMLQAERLAAIGQTVATLSHHIKNILQGIQGGSYLIETGLGQHNETFISKGWKIVDRNQNRISSLILDMLTFSKDRKPELVRDNLNRVVAEVVELMQTRAGNANILLTWTPDIALPDTLFDPEAIHHAILNLVTNAIDAVAEEMEAEDSESLEQRKTARYEDSESIFADGSHIFDEDEDGEPAVVAEDGSSSNTSMPCGQIDVLTQWDPQRKIVRIFVKDTGPGLTKEQVASIFKPFESSKGSRGTGLGLPVCKKIIREHGGTIHVEPRVPHGTRFVITLPIIQE